MENEKNTERYLRNEVCKIGGTAYKFVSPGCRGVPDRLICLPFGVMAFAEIKSEGKVSTPNQVRQQEKLRALGFKVYADVDTKSKVDEVVKELKNEIRTARLSKLLH